MEAIKITGTDDTPVIIMDKDNGVFLISGRSLPEDATAFFDPVLEWIEKYAADPLTMTVFDFKLSYFNTASSKLLLDILLMLEKMSENGHDVSVRWYYPDDDEDMQEAGLEYADIVDIPFEHIAYPFK
ncbi:MAG: DUF1987 domain-containing protein [Bacteroidetes bacterium]|nr:DUF1987 domain-containing protein [Bacteroidota bacterium]